MHSCAWQWWKLCPRYVVMNLIAHIFVVIVVIPWCRKSSCCGFIFPSLSWTSNFSSSCCIIIERLFCYSLIIHSFHISWPPDSKGYTSILHWLQAILFILSLLAQIQSASVALIYFTAVFRLTVTSARVTFLSWKCHSLNHYILPVSIHSRAPSPFSEATSIIEKRRKNMLGLRMKMKAKDGSRELA